MGPFHVTFSQPDLEADSEVKVISFAGLAVLLLLGSVGYALHRNLPSAWRRGVLCFMLLPMVIGPTLGDRSCGRDLDRCASPGWAFFRRFSLSLLWVVTWNFCCFW
eukprot:g2658.t1